MTELIVPISPDIFWPILWMLSLAAAVFVVFGILPGERLKTPWLDDVRDRLGLAGLNGGLFAIALILYAGLVLVLLAGLFWLIWTTIATPFTANEDQAREFLFHVFRLAGLTTVLGAVIALPFTLFRLSLNREQTKTATETLFNEKINAAAADLHAQRQVTERDEDGNPIRDVWQDDIIRRNAAIDRLEGLAKEYKGYYSAAERVARMLSVYVRELSLGHPPKEPPDSRELEKWKGWKASLGSDRSDLEMAVQILGRIRPLLSDTIAHASIDLNQANLQGLTLDRLDLRGANLVSARLDGSNLAGAQLNGADLRGACMRGAYMALANLRAADLWRAQLQLAELDGIQLDDDTNLSDANFIGAHVRRADLRNVPKISEHLPSIFGDSSTKPPEGDPWPNHWGRENENPLDKEKFEEQWRDWQSTVFFDTDPSPTD